MRSERASRVCIVVLEEVEEDEPSSSPPPPRPKSSSDRRSHHASRRAATHQDKVRWAFPFGSSLIELEMAESESVAVLSRLSFIYTVFLCVNDSIHWGFKQTNALLIPSLKFKPVLKCIVTRPIA